jgi:hypothetical protein
MLLAGAVAELKRVPFHTNLVNQLRERVAARLRNFKVTSDEEKRRLTKELARAEGDVERLVRFIRTTDPTASPGAFEAVRVSLEQASAEQRRLKDQLAALDAAPPPRVPTVDEIVGYVPDIEPRLTDDPVLAREALRHLLLDGRLTLHPQDDGTYRVESVIFPMRLQPSGRARRGAASSTNQSDAGDPGAETTKPRDLAVSGAPYSPTSGEVVEIGSCAGAMHGVDHAISGLLAEDFIVVLGGA